MLCCAMPGLLPVHRRVDRGARAWRADRESSPRGPRPWPPRRKVEWGSAPLQRFPLDFAGARVFVATDEARYLRRIVERYGSAMPSGGRGPSAFGRRVFYYQTGYDLVDVIHAAAVGAARRGEEERR